MNVLIKAIKIVNLLKKNRKLIVLFVLFMLLELSGWQMSYADDLNIKEYQVKAVFWYNFTKFTTWPQSVLASGQSPLRMCILGDDPFRGEMELAVKSATSQEHPIEIKYIKTLGTVKDCHTLFISRSEHEHLPSILSQLKQAPILTVSDIKDFAKQGGMIEFYHEENKVRFMVELNVLLGSGLKAHAQLLKISKIVQRTQ